jgi:Holliday junction resolvase
MLEKGEQSKIIKFLRSKGCYVFKVSLANRNGVPDLIGCYQGKFFAIEVKRDGKEPTELQKWNLEQIRRAGGYSMVANTLEEVKSFFVKEFGGI